MILPWMILAADLDSKFNAEQWLTEIDLPGACCSITVKLNRGTFPIWLLLAATLIVGAHTLHLE